MSKVQGSINRDASLPCGSPSSGQARSPLESAQSRYNHWAVEQLLARTRTTLIRWPKLYPHIGTSNHVPS
jgi:hypothetical protein